MNSKKIQKFYELSKEKQEFFKNFILSVNQEEEIYQMPYLGQKFHYDSSIPSIIAMFEEENLIGLVALYADNPDTLEVAVKISSTPNLQEIFKLLALEVQKIANEKEIQKILYVSEKKYYEKYSTIFPLNIVDSEYLLYAQKNISFLKNEPVQVRQATFQDVDEISKILIDVFNDTLEQAKIYAESSFEQSNLVQFVALIQDKIVGITSIDVSEKTIHFFGTAVSAEYQNRGIGQTMIQHIMKKFSDSNKLFELLVNKENMRAKHVYEKCGFHVVSEVVYLE